MHAYSHALWMMLLRIIKMKLFFFTLTIETQSLKIIPNIVDTKASL